MAKELIFIKDNNGAATLVGVVSWGEPCALLGYPTIYSGLYAFSHLFTRCFIYYCKSVLHQKCPYLQNYNSKREHFNSVHNLLTISIVFTNKNGMDTFNSPPPPPPNQEY